MSPTSVRGVIIAKPADQRPEGKVEILCYADLRDVKVKVSRKEVEKKALLQKEKEERLNKVQQRAEQANANAKWQNLEEIRRGVSDAFKHFVSARYARRRRSTAQL